MTESGLYGVPVGTLDLPRSDIHGGDDRSMVTIPVVSYVLVRPDRIFVVDTGNSPESLINSEEAWGPVGRRVKPKAESPLPLCDGLEKLGIAPEDVTDVVQTHLHIDHTGELRQFKKAKVWVQKAELRWALHPQRYFSMPYVLNDFDPNHVDFEILDGDAAISDDVHVVFAPGHSPGHQLVVLADVRNQSGLSPHWYVVVGDAIYSTTDLLSGRFGGSMWNAEEWWSSRCRLLTFERVFGATLLVPHDESQRGDAHSPWRLDA